MARMLCRLALLGLALAGSALSSPRDEARKAEVEGFAALGAREPVVDHVLEKRQSIVTATIPVITLVATEEGAASSTTISSTLSSSVVTTSIASTTASSSAAVSSTAASSTATNAPSATANTAGNSATSSPTPSPTPSGGGGLSGGAIAGIVVGVLAALAIAAGLGFFLARRSRHRKDANNANMPAFTKSQNQQPPQAMKEAVAAPYAGPSTGNGVYTSVTANYQPAQQQVPQPTFSELPADSRQLQPPQPAHVQSSGLDSPHGRSELGTRE